MEIKQIEPKFEEHDKIFEAVCGRIESLEEQVAQLAARLQEHEQKTVYDAHVREVDEEELPPDEKVFKAAADAADGPLQEAVNAVQDAETPTEIAKEAAEPIVNVPGAAESIFEEAEEVAGKVATEVDDATFPEPEQEPEPEPEKVDPVATVEVVVSGDLDPGTAALLKRLEHIDTDVVKVTVDKRE